MPRATRSAASARPSQVVVALGARRVALPAARIVEVAPVAGYTPLPSEDRTALGVVLHRDRLVPLLDLASRLGARAPGPLPLPALTLFVETADGMVAFPIDRVLGLRGASVGTSDDGIIALDPADLGAARTDSTQDEARPPRPRSPAPSAGFAHATRLGEASEGASAVPSQDRGGRHGQGSAR